MRYTSAHFFTNGICGDTSRHSILTWSNERKKLIYGTRIERNLQSGTPSTNIILQMYVSGKRKSIYLHFNSCFKHFNQAVQLLGLIVGYNGNAKRTKALMNLRNQ